MSTFRVKGLRCLWCGDFILYILCWWRSCPMLGATDLEWFGKTQCVEDQRFWHTDDQIRCLLWWLYLIFNILRNSCFLTWLIVTSPLTDCPAVIKSVSHRIAIFVKKTALQALELSPIIYGFSVVVSVCWITQHLSCLCGLWLNIILLGHRPFYSAANLVCELVYSEFPRLF